MRKIALLLLFATLTVSLQIDGKNLRPKAKHVIFIGIDGWATQVYKDHIDVMPTIRYMMENGSWTLHKRSVMPSASAINWASIFMGVPTEMHCYNAWNSKKPVIEAYGLGASEMPVTLYTLYHEQRPDKVSGCIYNWDGIGYVVDTAAITFHLYDPGYHTSDSGYTLAGYTEERAVRFLKEAKPDFFTFYIGDVDEVGHRFGWESKEYLQCLADTDAAIATIVKTVKELGMYDDTIFIISSDHGGKGKGHGGFTLEEMETPFVMFGKNISADGEFDEFMMQYDVTATIARALGLKVPKQWRGQVMPVFK